MYGTGSSDSPSTASGKLAGQGSHFGGQTGASPTTGRLILKLPNCSSDLSHDV